MFDQFIKETAELIARGESFVTATVVRAIPPTSGKPGDKAIIHADGRISGWIGGGCAQPVVIKEAMKAQAYCAFEIGADQPIRQQSGRRNCGLHHDMPQRRSPGHLP